MSDATIFVLFFGGLFVLRAVIATVVFLWILPRGDRCPICNAVTLRLETPWALRWISSLRRSWCLTCGWHGTMRLGPLSEEQSRTRALVE